MSRKTTQLKKLIESDRLEFIMEAHNGISAKIVEEAGFKGIWGSGLAISASLGTRDNNELSWTQMLDIAEFMADATTIPILRVQGRLHLRRPGSLRFISGIRQGQKRTDVYSSENQAGISTRSWKTNAETIPGQTETENLSGVQPAQPIHDSEVT